METKTPMGIEFGETGGWSSFGDDYPTKTPKHSLVLCLGKKRR